MIKTLDHVVSGKKQGVADVCKSLSSYRILIITGISLRQYYGVYFIHVLIPQNNNSCKTCPNKVRTPTWISVKALDISMDVSKNGGETD